MSIFRNKKEERLNTELREKMIGMDNCGHTVDDPANYSVLNRIYRVIKRADDNEKLIHMLLDELGYEIEEARTRLVKKKGSK